MLLYILLLYTPFTFLLFSNIEPLIIIFSAVYFLTIDADLSISIFVCSLEECFCLSISQISTILGEALQYKPEKSAGCINTQSSAELPICICLSHWTVFFVCVLTSYLSSSSSMNPLPSTSRTWKTFLTFSADMAFIPTISKNFLGLNVSATIGKG